MMQITLQQVGKRFNHHWIFRKVNAVLQSNAPVAITGANGSGKRHIATGNRRRCRKKTKAALAGNTMASLCWMKNNIRC
jgi:ATPase components of ABC transporters with duplicated ATPase domains